MTRRPQPCLTRIDGETCHGVLVPVGEGREWRCTEGHTMWGAGALRSTPWPADVGETRCGYGQLVRLAGWVLAGLAAGILGAWWRRR